MANRSIDRIRNKKTKDELVIVWPFGDDSSESNKIVYVVTEDYPEDEFLEIADCNIARE